MRTDQNKARRTRRGSGAVTLHDVAKLAGVAPITASRALNYPDQVSAEVLQKVGEAVKRTGYVRNRLAGGLASARSRMVAAVLPSISGPVFLQTVQALTDALAERGYQLMIGQSGYDRLREGALLEAIVGRRPDGIVVTGIVHTARERRLLLAAGIPVVEIWDLTPTPLDMLAGFSHEAVGRAVAQYLYARGRRRMAVVAGDDERSVRREQAFAAAARELGAREVLVRLVHAPTTLASGRAALAEILERSPDVDAVFCSSDLPALGVMIEAQTRGIAIPERLAIVGFGDLDFAADLQPALTTVHIDSVAIGRKAADFIVDRAEGRQIVTRVVDVGFAIVQRGSS